MGVSYYFMSDLERQLTQLYEKEKTRRTFYRRELKQLPEGKLVIRQQESGRFYFYEKCNGVERGITRQREHAGWLARKMFLQKCLDSVEQECKVLANALKQLKRQNLRIQKNSYKTFKRLPLAFPEKRYRYSRRAIAWMEAPYERNPFHPEQLIYQTKSGILVRSKSERMIADFLSEHGIPFRYEAKLLIDGKAYYPDFMILCEDDTLILWEHFGLMSQDEYFKRACEKIKTYRKKGYMQHANLICTWEEDLLQVKQLEEILERFGIRSFSDPVPDGRAAA